MNFSVSKDDMRNIRQRFSDRALRNTIANFYGTFVALLFQLAQVPLFLTTVGPEAYADWLILTALPTYLTLVDLGFGSAAATRATEEFERGHRHRANTTIASVWWPVTLVTLVTVAATTLLTVLWAPISLPVSVTDHRVASLILSLQLAYFALWMQGGFVESAFRAARRAAIGTYLYHSFRLVDLFCLALTLINTQSLLAVAVSLTVSRAVGLLVFSFLGRKWLTWFRLSRRHCDWRLARTLARPSLAYVSLNLGHSLNFQGYTLLVGSQFGSASLVLFNTARIIGNVVKQATTALNRGVMPELTVALAAGSTSRFTRLSRKLQISSLGVSVLALCLYLAFGDAAVKVWTGGEVAIANSLAVAFLAATTAESWWTARLTTLMSANQHVEPANIYLGLSFAGITAIAFLPISSVLFIPVAMVAVVHLPMLIVVSMRQRSLFHA